MEQNKDYSDFNVQKEILLEYLQVMIASHDCKSRLAWCSGPSHGYERIRSKE